MSDFLDRLASRAIGSDSALVPRLPSLFEPLQRAPPLPLSDEGGTPAHGRDAPMARTVVSTAGQPQPTHAASPPAWRQTQATPTDFSPVSEPEHAVAPAQRHAPPSPSPDLAPRSTPPVDRSAAASTPEHRDTSRPPSPVSPRQTRIAPERQAPAPQSASGSLRPSPVPVFGTPRLGPGGPPPGPAATRRMPAVPAGSETGATSEPVVHVSIGRLEVRAAAAPAVATQRRDGPRPSSLDDYLRQRGDKGAR